jgi:spermidine synthase
VRREDPGGLDITRASAWIFFAVGFGAQLAQVVYMRELFSTFQGTEFAVAIVLAAWLLWTAAGSAIAGALKGKLGRPDRPFVITVFALSLLVPATLVALRTLRGWLPVPVGEIPSPGWLALASLLTLLPVCALSGSMFVFGAAISRAPARVYALECFGAAVAGALLTWILLPWIDPAMILILASGVLAGSGCRMLRRPAIWGAAVAAAWLGLMIASPWIDHGLQLLYWRQSHPDFDLVETRTSRYGSLAIVHYREQHTLYCDGHPVASFPDRGEGAPAAHLVMLQHPKPKRVLMVGGGLNGTLKEVLRHPVERVDYVELDPATLEISKPFLAEKDRSVLDEKRVEVFHRDGRAFVASADGPYDLIFVQAPDPTTLSGNRFYTEEFFRSAERVLADDGVFALGHPLTHGRGWSPSIVRKLRMIRSALANVFSKVRTTPGSTVLFLAGKNVTLEEDTLINRMMSRLEEPVMIFGMTDVDDVLKIETEIATGRPFDPLSESAVESVPCEPNRDGRPEAAYRAMVGALEISGDKSFRTLEAISSIPWWILLLISAAVGAPAIRFVRGRSTRLRTTGLTVVTAGLGLFAMLAEVCLLMEFQAMFGYLYEAIGMLFACFMAGAGFGSLLGPSLHSPPGALRRTSAHLESRADRPKLKQPEWPLWGALIGIGICAAIAFVPMLGAFLGTVVIGLSILATGFVTGAGFALACARSESSGALYAGDVMGACLGAVVVPLWLLPLAGSVPTALTAVAVFVVTGAILLLTPSPRTES